MLVGKLWRIGRRDATVAHRFAITIVSIIRRLQFDFNCSRCVQWYGSTSASAAIASSLRSAVVVLGGAFPRALRAHTTPEARKQIQQSNNQQ